MKTYEVTITASFTFQSNSTEEVKTKVKRVLNQEGFSDKNFELTTVLLGSNDDKKVKVKAHPKKGSISLPTPVVKPKVAPKPVKRKLHTKKERIASLPTLRIGKDRIPLIPRIKPKG